MTSPAANVIRFLQSGARPQWCDGPTDADLARALPRTRGMKSHLSCSVRRHAGMVLRVCRSILKDHHTAEDVPVRPCFWALAQQAAIVGRRGAVAGWLYHVAWRIAAKVARRPARRMRDRTSIRSQPAIANRSRIRLSQRHPPRRTARLPEKYRVPLLLCFFEALRTRRRHSVSAGRSGRLPAGSPAQKVACFSG